MKKMDKFIKEKLDKWDEAENIDIVVPDSSACKSRIRMQLEARQAKKKRKMVIGFSMGGLATAVAVLIIIFTLILTPSFVYTDRDLIAYNVSIDELRTNYGVLTITDMYDGFNCQEAYIHKHKDTQAAVHAKLSYEKNGGMLELRVVLVDNYKFVGQESYDNLTQNYSDKRFTGSFDFKNDILYAKLNSASKQYFLQFIIEKHSDNSIESDINPTLEGILMLLQ